MRVELPDPRLQEAVDANRRHLLLTGAGAAPARDTAAVVAALDRYGFHDEAAEAVASILEHQRPDGSLARDGETEATGALLWAMAHRRRLTGDRTLAEPSPESIAGGLHHIERARRAGRGDQGYPDAFSGIAGMEAGAELLDAAGETKGAADARRGAASFRAGLDADLEAAAARLGTAAVPAGPGRSLDAGAAGSLAACWPYGVLPATDPRVAATAELVRERWCRGPAVFGGIGAGLVPQLTLRLAAVEVEAGDRRALERLAWVLDAATPTWTWPEGIHPRLPGGCAGDGHHRGTTAELLSFVRSMLVREVPGGLALASMVPDAWLGQGWEVHDAPTGLGRLSYAVRWHGERPALLWELTPHPGVAEARVTAPGLDPVWSSSELRGDALLAAPSWAEPVAVEPGESFG
jgi:hypothetical protein